MISVSLVNLALNPIFIFGLFGFPRMELQGAALATVTAFSVAFIMMLYVLGVKLKFMTLQACHQRVLQSWKAILNIAVPAAGNHLMVPFTIAITTWMVAQYGSDAVAGYGVASRIESFGLIILGALSTTLAVFAGQNMV